ncbi:hypothetical protein HK101_009016 [Irineochytrium annulatum]|nr:hypothetical protein HK101_009016 [Irineochytrium annulatum]
MRPLPAASTPTPSSARHGSHWRAGDHRHHRYQSSSSATIIEDGLCRASYELPPSSAKHRGTGPLAVTTELSGYPSPQETYTNTTLDRDSDDEYDLMGGDDHGEDDGVNYEAAEDEGEGKSSPVDMRERFLRNRSMFEVVQQVQEDGRRGPGDDVEIQRPRKDPQPAASTRLYNLPHTRRSPSPSPTRTPRDRNPYARKRSSSEGRYDKQIAAAPDTIAPYLVRHRPTDSTDEEEEEVALRRRGASEDESEDDSEGDDKDNSDDDSEDDSESEEETTTRGGRAAGSVIHAVSVDGLRSQFEKLGASILPPQPIATAAAAVARLASVRIQRAAEEAEEDHREERGHRTRVVRVEVPREADRRRSSPERVLRGVSRERGAEAPAASDESGRVESSSRLDALLDEERRREREHKEEMRRRKEEEDRLAAAAEMARLNMEEEEAKRQRKREREAKQQEREARRRAEEAERERIEREAWRAAERERIERVVEEERIRREERAQMEREAQDREERKLRDKAEAETAARVKAEDEARRLRAVAAQKDAEAKRLAADLEATQRVNLALMERMQQQQQPIAPAQTLAIAG